MRYHSDSGFNALQSKTLSFFSALLHIISKYCTPRAEGADRMEVTRILHKLTEVLCVVITTACPEKRVFLEQPTNVRAKVHYVHDTMRSGQVVLDLT